MSDHSDITPIIGPAGTIHMSLQDLGTYGTEHLRGELGAGTILSTETYKRLHSPNLEHYGYGWVMKEPTGELPYTTYWHNGSNTMWYARSHSFPIKKWPWPSRQTIATLPGRVRGVVDRPGQRKGVARPIRLKTLAGRANRLVPADAQAVLLELRCCERRWRVGGL